MEVGEREIIYLSLHCYHQNDFCIKMGSHFNVSVGSDGQSHKTVSTNHNLFEEKGEPKQYRTEVLLLTSLTTRPNRLTMLIINLICLYSQSRGCSSPCFSCICPQWFIQILMAVQYIHSKKVLHRCVYFLYAFCQSLFMTIVVITHT